MTSARMRRFTVLLSGVALMAAACGRADSSSNGTSLTGALEGMKGTKPLVELSDEFASRLNAFWVAKGNPPLIDFTYGAEAYDAVVLIALAAEAAGTDGSALASEIVNVSKGGQKCTTYAECKALLDAGTDIDYDGVSGPQDMNGNGDPLVGSYGILRFGAKNRIDHSQTYYEVAAAPASLIVDNEPVTVERAGDGVLTIGSLAPETGARTSGGPPKFAGVELAIADINEAGGVLGKPVDYLRGDSGDASTDIASQTVERLLAADVDAIIAATSSSVSLAVIDTVVAAGVVHFSPSNTSDRLSTYDDKGLYFRTAPPDTLQGVVVSGLIATDGNSSVYIMALDDAYGTGLAAIAERVLTESGVTVLGKKIYDPTTTNFDAEVNEIKAADPDAVLLITLGEGARILRSMVAQGIGPNVKNVYGVDGNMENALGERFEAGE